MFATGDRGGALRLARGPEAEWWRRTALFHAGDWAGFARERLGDQDIEALGFRAAGYRLAGDADGFARAVRELVAHPVGKEPSEAWFAAEALLINEQPDDAVAVLRKARSRYRWRGTERLDYAGWRPPTPGARLPVRALLAAKLRGQLGDRAAGAAADGTGRGGGIEDRTGTGR